MWTFRAPVSETRPLHEHIDSLWSHLRGKEAVIADLKRSFHVDVFLGYRSNCDTAGVVIPPTSLEMFVVLGLPLGLSIIVA